MASFDPPRDLDDEVFVGPVTQRELIITWRKRRQARLERERAKALKNEKNCAQPSSVDGEEPDAKKLHVHSEEREGNLEVTNYEQPSENTSNSYKSDGQASDYQPQATKTECTSIEKEGTEDNIFQIDHNCVGNVSDFSIIKHLSKTQGELVLDPMAMFTNPEESADILKEDKDFSVTKKSVNHEEPVGESSQRVAGSILTQSKEASYSSIDEYSSNDKCNEFLEIELRLVAEQAVVENREDETSTDDQSEIYEMSVDEIGLLNAVVDTPSKTVPCSEDISIHDKSIGNKDTEVHELDKNETDFTHVSQNSPTIVQLTSSVTESAQHNDQKSSKEASFIDVISIIKCSEIQETESVSGLASIESVEHESESAVLKEPVPSIKDSLGEPEVMLGPLVIFTKLEECADTLKEDEETSVSEKPENHEEAVGGSCQLVALSIRTRSKEASYSSVDESINEKCNEFQENELELVAEQGLVEYREDESSTDDPSEIYEMSVDVVGLLNAVEDTPSKKVPSSEDISIHDKSVENKDTEVHELNRNENDVDCVSHNSPTVAQKCAQHDDQKPSKEASFSDGISIIKCSEIQETESISGLASIESVEHESECAVLEEKIPSIKDSLGNPQVILDSDYQSQDNNRICASVEIERDVEGVFHVDSDCSAKEDVSINENMSKTQDELVSGPIVVSTDNDPEDSMCLLQKHQDISTNTGSDDFEEALEDSDYQPPDNDRTCTSVEKVNTFQTDNNCDAKESKEAPSVKDASISDNLSEIREEVSGRMVVSTNYTPKESVCLLHEDEETSAINRSGNYEEAVEDSDYQPPDNDRTCTSVEKEVVVEVNIFPTENNCDANESKEAPSVQDASINDNLGEMQEEVSGRMVVSTNYTPQEPVCLLHEDEETSAIDKSGNYEEAVEDNDRTCTSVEEEAVVEVDIFPTDNCDAYESKEAPSVKDASINDNLSVMQEELSGPMMMSTNYTPEESVCLLHEDEETLAIDRSGNYEEAVEESHQPNSLFHGDPSKEASYSDEDMSSNKICPEIRESMLEPIAEQQVPIERKTLQSGSVRNGVGGTSADDQSEIYEMTVEEVFQLSTVVLETPSKAAPSAEDISIHDKSSENQEPEVQHVTSIYDKHHECPMTIQDSVQLSAVTDLEQSMEVDDTSIINNCSHILETESIFRLKPIESVEHESDCALIDEPKSSIEDSLGKSAVTMPYHQHSDGEVLSLAHKTSTTDDIPINHGLEENKENGPSLVLDSLSIMPEVLPSKMKEPPCTGTVPRSNIPKPSILKPATLNVDPSSLNTAWVKRINMSKIPKPKRPFYVQPLDK